MDATSLQVFKSGRKLRIGDKTYTLTEPIGSGGSGIVYEATLGGRKYAVKLFLPIYQLSLFQAQSGAFAAWLEESAAFQRREHEFLSSLSHPNIVRVFDAGDVLLSPAERKHLPHKRIEQLPVLVTDFVEGLPLHRALKEGLSAADLSFILLRTARAMEYLHAERSCAEICVESETVLG